MDLFKLIFWPNKLKWFYKQTKQTGASTNSDIEGKTYDLPELQQSVL